MTTMNVEAARSNMIEQQIRPWDVLDQRVLDVLAGTRRELFVPANYRELAFADIEIPLAHGQAMLAPKLEGRLLQALQLRKTDEVLEIGTGSGYLSACLASLANKVESVEIFADLADSARARLEENHIRNVHVEVADIFALDLGRSRYDAIAVTGSLPLYAQFFQELLRFEGRLFVVVGGEPTMEALLITRVGDREWMRESLFETSLAPLRHAPRPDPFRF